MHNFQEEYRQAVDMELPEFHMDVKIVQDELHHHKMRMRQRRRMAVKGCTAAAVFLLLGAGTAAAKSYVSAVIEMRKNGYVVSSSDEDNGVLLAGGLAEEDAEAAWPGEELDGGEKGITLLQDNVEEILTEESEYENLSVFLQSAPVASKIPDLSLLQAELEGGRVSVMEDDMMICVHVTENGRSFCLRQSDYRNVEGFSSATAYSGENANERNLISAQGFSYTVFDTVDENDRIEATHAVIMVEGRELSLDYYGFESEFVDRMLKELDLDLYFR